MYLVYIIKRKVNGGKFMNISEKMCCIYAKDICCEDTVEQIVESEITLPEYFPDIVSVLRSTLRPNVSQNQERVSQAIHLFPQKLQMFPKISGLKNTFFTP